MNTSLIRICFAVLAAVLLTRPDVATAGPEGRHAIIFYSGGVAGTLEPCGCTSDPLGDIARYTGLVRGAGRSNEVLVVDAGGLLYPAAEIDDKRAEGADLRAAFLAQELSRLPFGGAALGELDLSRGPEKVRPRRLAANVEADAKAPLTREGVVHTVGGIKVGVLGLSDPGLLSRQGQKLGWKIEDPVVAARREAARLRAAGAEIVIALGAFERPLARQVARAGVVDVIVVGQGTEDGMARADEVEGTFIVAPADELERVGRLDLFVRAGQGQRGDQPGDKDGRVRLVDAGGEDARALERAQLERKRAQLEQELARFEKDSSADPTFVASKRQEREALVARAKELSGPFVPPSTGSYLINQLIPLRRVLPRDPKLAAAMRALDQKVGAANLRRAEPPPPAPEGRAKFVGDSSCARCHKPAMAFWKTTVHARAWKTIVDGGKTGFDDCVSCHVTGFGEIGGSSLGHVTGLTSVQCETCHGPGSLHVAAQGLEEPAAVRLKTQEATCVRCHNTKHSDTFDFTAYLRDVLGTGHGAKARAALGPGPTGASLRSAAKKKAMVAAQETLRKAR
jgi:hypothetical protein